MKRIFLFAMILLGAGACVERGGNNDKDGDTNNEYTEEMSDSTDIPDNSEFQESFTTSPYFSKWDTNGDELIDQNEFYQDYFAMMNKDEDKVLSKQEWQDGIKTHFGTDGEQEYGDFAKWDTNSDTQVQSEEFQQYMKDSKFFDQWDKNDDGNLEEPEFAEQTFAIWDTDGNGIIEADEYTDWNEKVNNF